MYVEQPLITKQKGTILRKISFIAYKLFEINLSISSTEEIAFEFTS